MPSLPQMVELSCCTSMGGTWREGHHVDRTKRKNMRDEHGQEISARVNLSKFVDYMRAPTAGIEAIVQERERQFTTEDYDEEHDDQYINSELAVAASCYALNDRDEDPHPFWPWDSDSWKPGLDADAWAEVRENGNLVEYVEGRQRELAKAGALIAAEIDRLQRLKNG